MFYYLILQFIYMIDEAKQQSTANIPLFPPLPLSHPEHHALAAHHQWCKCHPAHLTILLAAGSVARHWRKVAIKTSLRRRILRIVFRVFSLAAELPKRADIFPQYLPQQYQIIMGFILEQVFAHRDVIGLANETTAVKTQLVQAV